MAGAGFEFFARGWGGVRTILEKGKLGFALGLYLSLVFRGENIGKCGACYGILFLIGLI